MLKADFHMHTRFSRDSGMSPESMVVRCLQMGLNCIAVTDHNSLQGALAAQRIAPFRVIVGEEIKTAQGEIAGLFLKEEIPKGISPLDTVKRIKDQGGLVSIPHPFDHFRRSVIQRSALETVLPYTDIIEAFNARNTLDGDNRKALALAQEHGLLVSAVSDAHTPGELGHTYVEMPDFDGTPEGFKEALAQGKLMTKRTNPMIHILTTYTKVRRKFLPI